jgi:2-octaprenylphenol hydroxylase
MTERNAIPLWMRHADCYVQPRIALVGDAAHSIHPLAGQGVNIGLLDARALANKISAALSQGKDFSKFKILRGYERERRTENSMMIKLMAAFKSAFAQDQPWWVQLRGLGIRTLDRTQFIKKFMMKYVQGGN